MRVRIAEVPFPEQSGSISRFDKDVRKRGDAGAEKGSASGDGRGSVAKGGQARQQLSARGAAHGADMEVSQPHRLLGEHVEIGGL